MGCLKLTYDQEKPLLTLIRGVYSNVQNITEGYKFGFNGMEHDEIKGIAMISVFVCIGSLNK